MARIRTVKPDFFTSEQIADCSATARLLFIGLWCFCDDAGIHPASVKTLKMQVFPGDDIRLATIASHVSELMKAGLLIEYTIEDKAYWQVTGWHHQKIEKPSFKYPKPNSSTIVRRTLADCPPAEGKGMEVKGSKEAPPLSPDDDFFDRFWDVFPRKRRGNKQKARAAWNAASTRATKETIYESAKSYASSDEVARGYAKGAAAWLADDRWDVDYRARTSSGGLGSGDDARPIIENRRRSIEQPPSKWQIAGKRVIDKINAGEI